MALAFEIKTFDCNITRASAHERRRVYLKYAYFCIHNEFIGSDDLTALNMKSTVFWYKHYVYGHYPSFWKINRTAF
jgi:hypothetical protein